MGAAEISDSSRPALSHQAAHARQQPCSPTQGARRQHAQHSTRAFLTSCTPFSLGGGGGRAAAGEGIPRWPLDAVVGVTGSGIKVERLRGPPSHLPGCRSRPSVVGRSGSGRAVGWLNTGPSHHQHGRRRRHYHCHRPRAAALRTRVTLLRPRCGWEDPRLGGWLARRDLLIALPRALRPGFLAPFCLFRRPGSLGLGASYGRNKQGNFAAARGRGPGGGQGGAEGYHDLDSCANGRDTGLVTQVDARTLVCAS